jgi:hypothetical protein
MMPGPAGMSDTEIMRELTQRLNRGIGALIFALESQAGQDALDAASRAHAEENTAFLKALVAAHGWPGEARCGEQDQAAAGWLLAFSAWTDPGFQDACLELLARMLARGGVDSYFYAFTVDRVSSMCPARGPQDGMGRDGDHQGPGKE